ncbi:hypothetical protein AVL62_16295 [Serinicoccus chungangensis]|uniref:Uncharacterized protein n=1 Tax=Serinicoccus chungangensis TaxID=767452 RepID=A0A0W8I9C2_9MICO|nr:hypothetical protein AVL62_16295 [Serinicoccus chungangensis]
MQVDGVMYRRSCGVLSVATSASVGSDDHTDVDGVAIEKREACSGDWFCVVVAHQPGLVDVITVEAALDPLLGGNAPLQGVDHLPCVSTAGPL